MFRKQIRLKFTCLIWRRKDDQYVINIRPNRKQIRNNKGNLGEFLQGIIISIVYKFLLRLSKVAFITLISPQFFYTQYPFS